jgi:hypothetical protein
MLSSRPANGDLREDLSRWITIALGDCRELSRNTGATMVDQKRAPNSRSKRELTIEHFRKIKANSSALVQPYLVAIYREVRVKIEQIGTGFLVNNNGCAILITARHTLFGHDGDETPCEKSVFVGGSLKTLGYLTSGGIVCVDEHDLAAVRVQEFGLENCLPLGCFCDALPKVVTIHGYLARDFRRAKKLGLLRPAPRVYTNSRIDIEPGYIALRHPKGRNRNTDSGEKVMAARPSGMSGCPMLDGDKLAENNLSIVGVFTDYCRERGVAFGEAATRVLALLNGRP